MYGNANHVEPEFIAAYRWLLAYLPDKPTHVAESQNTMPIWAWYQCHSVDKKKPDLRHSGYLTKGTEAILLEIEKPEEQVLLSDYQLWHHVLNGWYLPSSMADAECFEKELANQAIDIYKEELANLPKPIKQKITASWQRIFNLDWYEQDITDPINQKSIQATFWSLHRDEVVSVKEFVAR